MSALAWLRPHTLRGVWQVYRAAARKIGPLRAVTDVPRTLRRAKRGDLPPVNAAARARGSHPAENPRTRSEHDSESWP